jgi:ribosomal protein S18 acetylase RimI-like enzyme
MKAAPAAPKRIVIRAGTQDDIANVHASLLGIATAVGETHKMTSTPDDLRRFGFGKSPAFSTLIAETDSTFAGMCLYFPIFSSWMGRPGVYIQDLYVEGRFRGLRIGERLLRRVAALSKAEGGVYLRLSVDAGNEAAQAFYRRLGVLCAPEEQVHKIAGAAFLAFADLDAATPDNDGSEPT